MTLLTKKILSVKKMVAKYPTDRYLFFVTLALLLSTLFANPGNKALLLGFFTLIFLYWLKTSSFNLSVLIGSVVSMVFHAGKMFNYQLISRELLPYDVRNNYEQGYNLHLVVTIYDVLSVIMLYLIARKMVDKKTEEVSNRGVLLSFFLYLAFSTISSLFSNNLTLSLASTSLSILPHFILLLFWSINFSKIKLSKYILPVIMALVLFQSTLGMLQFFKHGHLGLSIEPRKTFELFGAGVDENVFSFRPPSTFRHTNVYAIYLGVMILLMVPIMYIKNSYFPNIAIVTMSLGVLALLTTLGRSAWLSFGIGFLTLLYLVEYRLSKKIRASTKFVKVFFYLMIVGGLLTSISWGPRIQKIIYIFEPSSGLNTRLQQFTEAAGLIIESPLFGTGAEQSVVDNLMSNPSGVSSYFVSMVHNAYLLTAVETGIPSLLSMILLYFFMSKLFMRSYQRCVNKYDKIVVLSAMAAWFVCLLNGLFQPIIGFRLLILSIIVGNIPNEAKKNNA